MPSAVFWPAAWRRRPAARPEVTEPSPGGRPTRKTASGESSPGVRRNLGSVVAISPTRHLLRAKDLADVRYFEALSVADMARAAGLSKAHFSREFRRVFGEAPHQYLLTRRLERAAALLRTTDWPVARICFAVGLESVGSFTTSFQRVFGRSPAAYRASWPPAARLARIPLCIALAYGRPQNRTFREDASDAGP
jgi:AraC-like DNA-binding protein